MRLGESLESIRDFSVDVFYAGRLAVAQVLDKIDSHFADAINKGEDNE